MRVRDAGSRLLRAYCHDVQSGDVMSWEKLSTLVAYFRILGSHIPSPAAQAAYQSVASDLEVLRAEGERDTAAVAFKSMCPTDVLADHLPWRLVQQARWYGRASERMSTIAPSGHREETEAAIAAYQECAHIILFVCYTGEADAEPSATS
jgi:hypothetical protein